MVGRKEERGGGRIFEGILAASAERNSGGKEDAQ